MFLNRDFTDEELFSYYSPFDAVFLSPGAGIDVPLSIPGEKLEQVWKGREFLDRINSRVKIKMGKETIVIGGGNTAIDVARSALRLGSRVTVAYRRTRNEMPAIQEEIEEAEGEGIQFKYLIQPVKVNFLKNKRLAVKFQYMKLSRPDQGGRPKAIPVKAKFITLETDHLITAVGEQVDHSWLPGNLIKNGLIEKNPSPKIFAGGDAVDQPRTIVTAIGGGLISLRFCAYLSGVFTLYGKGEAGRWLVFPEILKASTHIFIPDYK